ncbi:hypothetical protein ACFOZ7_08260 [Natribaculum luteum]|uniref:Uncharacterized protein n=1 Tax=Natribaculum luteum TaxID=1586232 RepID=A0ABD5NYU4_9EURY|nr:hypothetical protein [Natribaculum luteum]
MSDTADLPEVTGYKRWQVYLSAVVALVVSLGIVWWVSGRILGVEEIFRVSPTVEGGGIGTDWLAGNTVTELDLLIALVHAADVIMGVFILVMVFVHWTAFRRLAGRMRQPTREESDAVAADGGRPRNDGGESQGGDER